jgi:hypothetical protein
MKKNPRTYIVFYVFLPLLDQYIGEFMVSIFNIDYGFKNVPPIKDWYFGGYVKVRESLYTWVNVWIDADLNHIDTRVIT